MEKPTRRECCILLIFAALVIFAWLCRLLGIPWEGGSNPIRAVIYPVLFIVWGFTLHRRLIHPQVRHVAVSLAAIVVFWFLVRTVKFSLPDQMIGLTRKLWYLYYMPMTYIPLLALLLALSIGLPETERLPRWCGLLWFVATALFLLVITNDLHQRVFVFPNDRAEWSDSDYSYSWGYWIISGWMLGCNAATLVLLAVKSRRPKSRRWVLLPCVPGVLTLCYWGFYVLHYGWFMRLFGDMTAACCVLCMVELELCIRCGLIRSNTGYGELFRVSGLGAEITDRDNVVRMSSANAGQLTAEQIAGAEKEPLFLDGNVVLKSKPIRFGRVLWREDVSELAEAIEEIEENNRDLGEQSRIEREKLDADRTLLALQEKNRAGDLLHRETAGQLELIDRLLSLHESETDETARRRLLAGAAVVGAYVKRYGNLLLVSERSEDADIADLTRCFEESFLNLELLGVKCLCSLPSGRMIGAKEMLRIYRAFESVLEDCLFDLKGVWANGRERDGQMVVSIEFACDTDLSRHAGVADAFSCEPGTARFSFLASKGGAEE